MTKLQFTLEDMLRVLERKGYQLENHPKMIPGKGKKPKYINELYALRPGVIYGLGRVYIPENTAEAVFSNLVRNRHDSTTPQDFLDSL